MISPFGGLVYGGGGSGSNGTALPGQVFPHVSAAAGTGTEASPYTSTDGLAGLGDAYAALTHGGQITLVPGRFDLTAVAGLNITQSGVSIVGLAPGANIDPNGQTEGVRGQKLRCAGTAFTIGGDASTGTGRLSGFVARDLYLWGKGQTYGWAASSSDVMALKCYGQLDQPKFYDLNFGNWPVCILASGGFVDTYHFHRLNALGCGDGIMVNTSSSATAPQSATVFGEVKDCCFADMYHHGVVLYDVGSSGWEISGCMFIRCAGVASTPATDKPDCALYLSGDHHLVRGCRVNDTGHLFITSAYDTHPYNTNAAHGIIVTGDRNRIEGNQIWGNTRGYGIVVRGNYTKLIHNQMDANNGGGSGGDILVDAGATNTEIWGGGLSIVNHGTGTTLNGTALAVSV